MLRFGLIGCGRIGAMHAANIARHPQAQVASVYDVHTPSAEQLAALHRVQSAGSPAHIFSDDAIDAVLIASATNTHADFIEQAVAAGKPVLCEKPIDINIARVNQCAAAIAGHDVPVQIGFNRRFDPGHQAAYKALRDGEIGALHQVVITSRDPEMPPRSYYEVAGGLLRDMTIHDFDLARYFLDDEPVEVIATGARKIDPDLMQTLDDHDTAMILMRTADGKQCHINNSRTAVYGYDQRIELMGEKGMLLSGNRKPHELQRFTQQSSEISQPYEYFFIERYRDAFMEEISAFVRAVQNGTPPEVSFEDGRNALLLAEAAYKSMAENRWVQVEEIV